MNKLHLLILGAGPGGYSAAFYAADQGYEVTLVDESESLGGVCLQKGCIPSKALLHIAGVMSKARQAKAWGIKYNDPDIDLKNLCDWKNNIVSEMSSGLITLCKQRGVNFINGRGKFISSNSIKISDNQSIAFDRCIIATGSRPAIPKQFINAKPYIMDSSEALNLSVIPERMLVIGGGYIGLEMGTVYSALGSRVTVVEKMNGLLPGVDRDLVRPLYRKLTNEFNSIYLDTEVVSVKEDKRSGCVIMNTPKGKLEEAFDRILVSVGRLPNTEEIGLENTKVELDERGFVRVDSIRQTSDPAILSIGDVAGEPMLAHKASHEARVAVEGLNNKTISFENRVIPSVVFTDPEIAWCGLTESDAKANGTDVEVVRFPWRVSGRAHTLDRTECTTKLILEPITHRRLGVGIVGYGAGELIAEGVLAINMGAKAEDLSSCIHPHPTLSETLMESAEVFSGTATHIFKRPRK